MLLWYAGVSVLLVANVFRSSGIDYRIVAAGALLPLVVDAPFGHRAYAHTLLFAVAVLVIVMIAGIGRSRLVQRRLLCLPIGVFCGLVLSGAWAGGDAFWWVVGQFDLYLPGPRQEFVRTGRLRETSAP